MNIAWYSRDGHLDIMALTAAELSRRRPGDIHSFICHNDVEAKILKERHGCDHITTMAAAMRRHFPQGDVSGAEIAALQEKYDAMPLIRAAWQDIHELGKREPFVTRNLVAHLRFWEAYLTENKIDTLVIELPAILSTCAAWLVCKSLGVHNISPIDIAPLGDRMVLANSWQGYYPGFGEGASVPPFSTASAQAQEYARSYLKRMLERPERTDEVRRKQAAGQYESLPVRKLASRAPGFFSRQRAKSQYYMSSGGAGWIKRWSRAYPNLLLHRVFRFFEAAPPPGGKPFFLMPLHEPREWSNYTWMGVRYGDLLSLVQEVSACLPPGTELYVKEHTSGFGLRPLSFYRKIKKLGNVRLIDPGANPFQLMQRSSGVVTLGSTMGWEAWLLGRPAILLGEPWYWRLPGLVRTRNAEELAAALQCAGQAMAATEEQKLSAIARLYDVSFQARKFPHPDALTPENVQRWASALESEFAEGPATAKAIARA